MSVKSKENSQEDRSYYSYIRDGIYDLPWKKIGVGILIAGIILAPMVAIALAPMAQNGECEGDYCLSQRNVVPLSRDAVTPVAQGRFCSSIQHESREYPEWYKEKTVFDSVALTGIDLQKNGEIVKTSEVVSEAFEELPTRNEAAIMLLKEVMRMEENGQGGIISRIFNSFAPRGLSLGLGNRKFSFGIHPSYVNNHKEALDLVERDFLSSDCKIRSGADMEAFISSLHKTLSKGLLSSEGSPIIGGEYRTNGILLQTDNVGIEWDEVVEVVRQKDPSAVKSFRKIYKKVFSSGDLEGALAQLSAKEKKIFSLVFSFDFVASKDVPKRMKQFSRQYYEKLKGGAPAIELAVWVHEELVHIHPWEDANGRVARALVNAELIRGGYPPFLIYNDQKYNQAVYEKKFKEHLLGALEHSRRLSKQFAAEGKIKRALIKF